MWTLLQSDYAHPGSDRTAGDDDALASAANELRYLRGQARKLSCVERVGARPSENARAELEENAPGFSGHAELLSKSENESAQKQFSPMMAAFSRLKGTMVVLGPPSNIAISPRELIM